MLSLFAFDCITCSFPISLFILIYICMLIIYFCIALRIFFIQFGLYVLFLLFASSCCVVINYILLFLEWQIHFNYFLAHGWSSNCWTCEVFCVTFIELFQNIFQTKLAIYSLELKVNLKTYMIWYIHSALLSQGHSCIGNSSNVFFQFITSPKVLIFSFVMNYSPLVN
jgi:hypothetical protein